jgi:arylsulfatase
VGQAGRWQSTYHDTMVDHDQLVGSVMKVLDDLKIADNTFVMYSTDNGPHMNSWPDAGMTPFRNEKNSNWEGAYRVPCILRWPGHIPAGVVVNDIGSHLDVLPTILSAAGQPNVKDKLLRSHRLNGHSYSVHLDGYDLVPFLTRKGVRSPRQEFYYFSDDGDLTAVRYDNWKLVFMEQRVPGTLQIWAEPFVPLRVPKVFNLRTDPYERADITSNTYYDWLLDRAFILLPIQPLVREFMSTFVDYPPRQRAASFTVDQVLEKLEAQAVGSH